MSDGVSDGAADSGAATDATDTGTPQSPSQAHFGLPLAQAREALGISVVDMAGRLRLHPRQISAIDDERLDLLPEPAFVRGFIRNYAKEVKLDPAPLLDALTARLPPPPAEQAPAPAGLVATEVRRAGVERASRLAVIGGTLAVLIVLGLVGWIASLRMEQGGSAALPGASPASSPTSSPASSDPQAGPQASAPASAQTDAQTDAQAASPSSAQPPAPGSGAPASAAATAPSTPASPTAASTPQAASPGTAASAPAATAPAGSGLRLVVGDRPSWVEITSADGRVALTGLLEPGAERRLGSLTPPLRLVIGNASSVTLEYRGKSIDLKPHVRANDLARLTLE
jgi:cytoskeleton protein RodZ